MTGGRKNTGNKNRKPFIKIQKPRPEAEKNFCGTKTTSDGKPIEIIRGAGGKLSCTKKGPRCLDCNLLPRK